MEKLDRIRGCMFGLAVGDAVGYPIEFEQVTSANIARELIRSFENDRGGMLYSDDTQMSLATARGLIKMHGDSKKDIVVPAVYFWNAYKEWESTQRDPSQRRAPGNTCLTALSRKKGGSINNPINNSKGCGGVMRTAPIGLVEANNVFQLGAEAAALTHGHPTGYLTAGVLSELISILLTGETIYFALNECLTHLRSLPLHHETYNALLRANVLSSSNKSDLTCIEELGEGWVAEEALAISIFCALRHFENFEEAILSAVCHSGDSDSTGCIAGAIVGTMSGYDAIPKRWRNNIENALGIEDIVIKLGELRG